MTSGSQRHFGRFPLVTVPVTCCLILGLIAVLTRSFPGPIDLEVYEAAGRSLVESPTSLYERSYEVGAVGSLPFTYPPIAAALAVPLAILTPALTYLLWVLTSTGIVVGYVWRTMSDTALGSQTGVAVLAASALWLLPVTEVLLLGQVGILMTFGCLLGATSRNPRAASLIGLFAAIKLTPLIFLPYFVITRQWSRLGWALGGFIAFTLIGAVIRPADSWQYFTDLVWDESRVGGVDSYANQSVLAWLTRLGVDGTGWWVIAAAVVGLCGMWLAWRWYHVGSSSAAAIIVGFTSVLVSPVSWQHHAVWILPGLVVGYQLVVQGPPSTRRRTTVFLAIALALSLLRLPHWSRDWPDAFPVWLWVPAMGSITVAVCLLLWLYSDLLRSRLPHTPGSKFAPELLR